MKSPTKLEIIKELLQEVQVYQNSYREADGKIRNRRALRTIAALQAAVKVVRRARPKAFE